MFTAFSGGGAGLVQLPALIFLGLPFGMALATHKIASVALGLGATLRHWREGYLERRYWLPMLLGGLPGVVIAANIIIAVPDRTAEIALGVLTAGLGVCSIFRRALGQRFELRHHDPTGLITGGLAMFAIGVLNGSLASGTGLFATLWLTGWHGFDYRRVVAYTLVMVGLFWNGTGALTLGLLAGSLIGGYLGAHLAIIKGNRWIKRGFEIVTLSMGMKLMIG